MNKRSQKSEVGSKRSEVGNLDSSLLARLSYKPQI